MYAVIQLGCALFGMGETEDEAVEAAAPWLDNPATGYQGVTPQEVRTQLFPRDWRYAAHGDLILTDDEDLIEQYDEG